MNTLTKHFFLYGFACLIFFGNIQKLQASKTKPATSSFSDPEKENKEQKLLEKVYQYLSANDSSDEEYLEALKAYPVEKVQELISNGQLTAYTLQQNKDTVLTGSIHGAKFTVAGRDTVKDKEYTYAGIVPSNYNSGKQYALIIHLHGMGRTGDSYIDKWEKVFGEMKTDNYILVCPTFPASNWSSKTGERIVMALMKKIKMLYNIDDNRIFLTGMSRGGGGTYNISKFHTDLFAGIAPIAGATDIENKALLLENFLNLPVYIIHGSKDDMVPVEYARTAYQKLKDLKCDVTYIEHDKVYEKMPSIGGHFYPAELLPDLVKWFDTKKRNTLPAKLFIYQTKYSHDRLHWLSAEELSKDTVSLEGEIKNNRIELKTDGVKKVKIFLNKELIDFSKPVAIVVNNKEVFKEIVKPDVKTLLKNYKKYMDKGMLFTKEVEVEL